MWIKLIEKVSEEFVFSSPAKLIDVEKAEKELGISFHHDLKEALLESDGIYGEYGLGLLWSVERIQADNINFRTNIDFKELYMPFDHLLFFADAGNGDQFAFPVQNGLIRNDDIFVWNHEDDSRNWVSPNLKNYFEGWLTGRIKI